MKKHTLLFLLISIFWSCKQKTTVIIPQQNPFEVMPSHFVQNVLIEDFVGEWNENSITAALKIDYLKNKYSHRIIAASLHQNDWLETPYTNFLGNLLGGLVSTPRASINRLLGEKTYQSLDDNFSLLTIENWENTVNRALLNKPSIALALETKTMSLNTGSLNVYLATKTTINEDTRIGIYFLEDSIHAVFQMGATDIFQHNNVLYNVDNFEGDSIFIHSESENGQIIKKDYPTINLSKYDLSKLKVVVFVYNFDNDFRKMHILNVQEVKWGGNKYWDN